MFCGTFKKNREKRRWFGVFAPRVRLGTLLQQGAKFLTVVQVNQRMLISGTVLFTARHTRKRKGHSDFVLLLFSLGSFVWRSCGNNRARGCEQQLGPLLWNLLKLTGAKSPLLPEGPVSKESTAFVLWFLWIFKNKSWVFFEIDDYKMRRRKLSGESDGPFKSPWSEHFRLEFSDSEERWKLVEDPRKQWWIQNESGPQSSSTKIKRPCQTAKTGLLAKICSWNQRRKIFLCVRQTNTWIHVSQTGTMGQGELSGSSYCWLDYIYIKAAAISHFRAGFSDHRSRLVL